MRPGNVRKSIVLIVGLLIVLVLESASAARMHNTVALESETGANGVTLVVDPGKSRVHWTLGSTLHTVHGTFAVKSGSLTFDPETGKAGGAIIVDALSGESGNDGRDKKMHKEIIESAKYQEIKFHPDRVEGKIALQGDASAQVHGVFSLHGSDHEMTVPFQADFAAEQWKGSAKFTVPYIAWGLKNPSNFFLKADPSVQVQLELAGKVENTTAAK